MKFPVVTIAGIQCRMLLVVPNWESPVRIMHRMDVQVEEGITGIEERRPKVATMTLTQKVQLQMVNSEADDWQKGIAQLNNGLVAIPVWPDLTDVGGWPSRIYDAEYVVNFDGTTDQFAVYDKASIPLSPPYQFLAPLMVGVIKQRPALTAVTDKIGVVDLEVEEASPYSFRVTPRTYGSSWSFTPNWVGEVKSASYFPNEVFKISDAREYVVDKPNLSNRWRVEAEFMLDGKLSIRQAISFFYARNGAWESWSSIPAWFHPGADTPDDPANLTVRFATNSLDVTFHTDTVAVTRVPFLQELNTPGVQQKQSALKFLYRVMYDADPGNPELYTNYDAPITTAGDGTFNPEQAAHKMLRMSLKPQDEKAEFEIRHIAGSLFDDHRRNRLYKRVVLSIWEIDPSSVLTTQKLVWEGVLREVVAKGQKYTASFSILGGALKRQFPGFLLSPRCNYAIFDADTCKLTEAGYVTTGTTGSGAISGGNMAIAISSPTGWGGSPWPDNFFAGGVLRTGTGRNTIIAQIISSGTGVGGEVILYLNKPLWSDMLAPSQSATLLPGCDGQVSTCNAFGNYLNFGGTPFVPEFIAQQSMQSKSASK